MSKSTLALVLFVIAAILAALAAAWETPYHGRLLALAVAFTAAGLAVEAS